MAKGNQMQGGQGQMPGQMPQTMSNAPRAEEVNGVLQRLLQVDPQINQQGPTPQQEASVAPSQNQIGGLLQQQAQMGAYHAPNANGQNAQQSMQELQGLLGKGPWAQGKAMAMKMMGGG